MTEERTPTIPHSHRRILFNYTPHPHKPQNVNLLFEAEKAAAGFNKRVAVRMTRFFSVRAKESSEQQCSSAAQGRQDRPLACGKSESA